MISRRTFVAAGLAIGVAPRLAAQPKPAGRVFRVGILAQVPLVGNVGNVNEFKKSLKDLGYVEGQNLLLEYRSADGRDSRYPALAAELAKANADVIVAGGTPAALAARALPQKLPVVAVSAVDPVETGLVASLEKPGANVTGTGVLTSEVE